VTHGANGFFVRACGKALSYKLEKGADIKISLYDVLGRKAASVVNGHQFAGKHSLDISRLVGKGVYLCTFENARAREVQRIVLK